jgi:uncharacterized protein (TIGR02266 family)
MFHVASEETYQDGQLIAKEGGAGDWIYIVLSGRVELSKKVGEKKFVIETLKPGEIFGELGFFSGVARTSTARALGETKVGIIDRTSLDEELNKLSEGFRTVLMTTLDRYKNMVDRASSFSLRSSDRIPVSLPVTYKDEKTFIKVFTANVSGGGLFIKTDDPLEAGEQLLVNLRLPEREDSIIIKCKVVWVRPKEEETSGFPAGMGIKFVDVKEKDNQILEEYVARLSQSDE